MVIFKINRVHQHIVTGNQYKELASIVQLKIIYETI